MANWSHMSTDSLPAGRLLQLCNRKVRFPFHRQLSVDENDVMIPYQAGCLNIETFSSVQ